MDVKRRILIADDDAFARIVIENWLKNNDFDVVSTADGESCLEQLALADFDVVLTDLNMPGIDGIEVASRIKNNPETEDLPVLILTAEYGDDVLRSAFEAGAMDYLRKPTTEIELLARVTAASKLKLETERRKAKERELERSLVILRDDLAAAGRLQRSALPKSTQLVAGLEFAWYFHPCEAVGGDVLNYFSLSATQVAAYLLDVSGHGVSSAMHAMTINSTLLRNNTPGGLLVDVNGRANPPGDVVESLNDLFLMNDETGKYFTFIYLVIDLAEQTISFAQAGHPPVIEVTNGEVGIWREGDLPVGMFPNSRFETHTRKFGVGTRVYVYSDGITEAENDQDEFYGQERLLRVLTGGSDRMLQDTVNDAVKQIHSWVGKRAFGDDVSLLAIELAKDIKTTRVTVDATLENVRSLAENVRKIVVMVNGDEMAAMWVDLVVSEAATNIVKHGYADDFGVITMEVTATSKEVVVSLLDSAKPYNPTENLRSFEDWDVTKASEDGGGLGKSIMFELADSVEYERIGNRNKLVLRRKLPIDGF